MPDLSTSATPRFQVLALDGGGLKGIFSAAALAALEEDFGGRIVDRFDLITGTSTGGLIALGLAAGCSPQEILDFYLEQGTSIFPTSGLRRMRRLRRPYKAAPLRGALEDLFGELVLADSPVRLAIPSYDLTSNDVHLFRTPHLEKLRRDSRVSFVDVGLATTAAPTFLPVHNLEGQRLVDGGVWANNPSMVGVVEALVSCDVPREAVHVLNIGTTTEIAHSRDQYDDGSPIWWAKGIVDVTLRGQVLAAHNHSGLLLGPGKVTRIDVPIPRGRHALDRVHAPDLVGRARAASRKVSPHLADTFAHAAPPYRNNTHEATP